VLIGLNRTGHDRFALSSRYQYPSAIFLLLIAVELLRGVRIPRLAIVGLAAVAAAAAFGGISILERDYDNTWKPMADEVRLTLAAVEIAGDSARPGSLVSASPVTVPLGQYLESSREHGSPAFSEAELTTRPEPDRATLDKVLASTSGIALRQAPVAGRRVACDPLPSATAVRDGTALEPGVFALESVRPDAATLRLGRFSQGFPVGLGRVGPDGATLRLPEDESDRPWRLEVESGRIRLCRMAAS